MRRTYLSSDFNYIPTNGTFNMNENKKPFSAKMMYITDNISIQSSEVVYYEQANGQQINLASELLLPPITYSPIVSKQNNSQLALDPSQTASDEDNLTKWILTVNVNEILIEFIYASIKKARTFQSILNINTTGNSIDLAINDYIKDNLLNRYKVSSITLYMVYNSLNNATNLRYKNNWNSSVASPLNINQKVNLKYNYDQSIAELLFIQDKNSRQYSFDYYFDLFLTRI